MAGNLPKFSPPMFINTMKYSITTGRFAKIFPAKSFRGIGSLKSNLQTFAVYSKCNFNINVNNSTYTTKRIILHTKCMGKF